MSSFQTLQIITILTLFGDLVILEFSSGLGNDTDLSGPAHNQTITDVPFGCTVRFRLDIPPKPKRYHKADTTSSHHPQSPVLTIGTYQWVELDCTCSFEEEEIRKAAAQMAIQSGNYTRDLIEEAEQRQGRLEYTVISTDGHVVVPTQRKKLHLNVRRTLNDQPGIPPQCFKSSECTHITEDAYCRKRSWNDSDEELGDNRPKTQGFYVYADNLGRSNIMVSLIWTNRLEVAPAEEGELVPILNKTAATTDHSMQLFITRAQIFVPETQLLSDIKQGRSVDLSRMEDYNSTTKGIWEKNIHVIVLLRPQKFYLASDWAAAVIAFMIALSVGCCNDPILFRSQLQNRKPILAGLICQFIVLPIFTLGIGACFSLDADEAFGMFATVIVPGGGFGYLLTYLVHGDRHLSATLSLLASLVNIVMFPLWMYGVGWLWFNRCIHMGKAIGWLGFIASAQALGTFMRGCRPSVAHAILTWVTRPLLLLAGILMITLGVYIHHYAFNEMTQKLVLCLMLPITFGFATGWTAGRITGQEIPVIKTLATEASLFNGLICMPLLRTSLHAPEGDMSAVLSLWAVFLSPMSLAYHAIVSVVHRWLTDFLQRRRKEREQNTIGMIIGSGRGEGNIGEMGAASVAAVAAAAIAVAPAITAGPRSNDRSKTNKELEENRTTGVLNERFNVTATPQKSNGRRSASTTEYPPTPFKIKPTDEGHIDENCYHTIGAEMTSLEARLLPHPSTSEGLRENQYLTTNYLYRQPKISRELGFELSEDCNVDPHLRSPRISDITGRHNLHQIKPHNTCTYETPKSIRQEELGYAYQPPRKPPGLHRSERHRPLPYTNL